VYSPHLHKRFFHNAKPISLFGIINVSNYYTEIMMESKMQLTLVSLIVTRLYF
jgi:hypothetical protein